MTSINTMKEFSFKILTYNIFGSLYLPSTRRRMAAIGQLLVPMAKEYSLDVICLQETFFSSWREKYLIQPWLKKFSSHASTSKQGFYLLDSGLVTLSKSQIIKSEFFGFSRAKGVDRFANKGVLLTRLQMPDGTELDIYNTHTQASYVSQKTKSPVRIAQVKEILAFVQKHSDAKSHVVLLGDLNLTEDNEEYGVLREGGFTDVMRTLYPNRDSHPMMTLKKSHPLKEKKIDHVFIKLGKNSDWKVQKSDVKILDLGLSDHRAVFAEIFFQITALR